MHCNVLKSSKQCTIIQTCPVGPLGGQRPLAALFSALNTEKRPPGCRTAASGGRPLGILPTPTPPTSSGGTQASTTQQMLIETLLGKESWKNPLWPLMTPCARRSFTAHPTITGYHWLRGRKQIFSGRLGFLFGPPQVPGEALCTRNLSVEARQPPRPLSPNLKGHLCIRAIMAKNGSYGHFGNTIE